MKTFVIDIGNSHTVMGVFKEGSKEPSATFRFRTDRECTSDELYAKIKQFFESSRLNLEKDDVLAVASVVPELNSTWKVAFQSHKIKFVDHLSPWSFKIALPDPRQAGADRMCNVEAVMQLKLDRSCIVIDAGTATTFDVIDRENGDWAYLGGIILPGVVTAFQSLVSHTSRLRTVEFERTKTPVLGNTTESALQSGVLHGFASQVEGLVLRLQNERPSLRGATIFATGGLATLLRSYSEAVHFYDEYLTLKGLYAVSKRQSSL